MAPAPLQGLPRYYAPARPCAPPRSLPLADSPLAVLPLATRQQHPGRRHQDDKFSCSMPAPATGSRHLYTRHHQDSMQSASWLRARPQGAPLSQDFRPAPVLMSAFYGFDASAVVHTCSSSRRTPRPTPGGTFPYRSRPRLLTDAAYSGFRPPTARRSRRTYLHHWHSTVHDGDHLPHVTPLSGHTGKPKENRNRATAEGNNRRTLDEGKPEEGGRRRRTRRATGKPEESPQGKPEDV